MVVFLALKKEKDFCIKLINFLSVQCAVHCNGNCGSYFSLYVTTTAIISNLFYVIFSSKKFHSFNLKKQFFSHHVYTELIPNMPNALYRNGNCSSYFSLYVISTAAIISDLFYVILSSKKFHSLNIKTVFLTCLNRIDTQHAKYIVS